MDVLAFLCVEKMNLWQFNKLNKKQSIFLGVVVEIIFDLRLGIMRRIKPVTVIYAGVYRLGVHLVFGGLVFECLAFSFKR